MSAALQLLVLLLGLLHGLRLQFLREPVAADEEAPAGQQNANGKQQAGRMRQKLRRFANELEGGDQAFNGERHDYHHHEA